MRIPRIIIAGTESGVGKTTIATGIVGALAQRGIKVQPFKVGPDYIDPGYHTLVAGTPSRNLDSWLLAEDPLKELFARAAAPRDIAVIEGVMGLFDGYRGDGDLASTAHIAKILEAPVLLVVNCRGSARSVAASVYGFQHFDPQVRVVGVILNNVASQGHAQMIEEVVTGELGLPVLGYLVRNANLSIPERHLGLVPGGERQETHRLLEGVTAEINRGVDLERLLKLAQGAPPLPPFTKTLFATPGEPKKVRLALARDKAFNFYYQDSLDLLATHGAELIPFSPLADPSLPPGCHGLYLGGGFPEIYGAQLADNEPMLSSLREAAQAGLPIYAECGGLMYLCRSVRNFDGSEHPLAGLIGARAIMEDRLAALGYVTCEVLADNLLSRAGQVLRGHEFHYSRLEGIDDGETRPYRLTGGMGRKEPRLEGFVRKNILASFVHLHLAGNPNLCRNLITCCQTYSEKGQ